MPNLDTTNDVQMAMAIGRRVPGNDIAQIGNFRLRQIPAPIQAGPVKVDRIGASHEIRHVGHRAIGDDANPRWVIDWAQCALALLGCCWSTREHRAEITRWATKGFDDLGFGRHPKSFHTRDFSRLDLVQLMIAAYQHENDAGTSRTR